MIRLSQRDPKWGGKTIGKTKYLIKDWGCTITCIAMLSDYFKDYHDPAFMAKKLDFTDEAKIYWKSIDRELKFKFEWRFYNYQETRIIEALKNPNKACVLEIKKRHWVVALRKVPYGYWVADPWDGRNKFMSTSSISGGTILVK